jgi:hypothetical protein
LGRHQHVWERYKAPLAVVLRVSPRLLCVSTLHLCLCLRLSLRLSLFLGLWRRRRRRRKPLVEYAAFAHRILNKTDVVESLCNAALDAAPDSAEAVMRVAWLMQVSLGQDKKARNLMQRCLTLAPNNACAHRIYGLVCPLVCLPPLCALAYTTAY